MYLFHHGEACRNYSSKHCLFHFFQIIIGRSFFQNFKEKASKISLIFVQSLILHSVAFKKILHFLRNKYRIRIVGGNNCLIWLYNVVLIFLLLVLKNEVIIQGPVFNRTSTIFYFHVEPYQKGTGII